MPTAVTALKYLVRSQANVQTLFAGLTCVLRRYGYNLNPCLDSFVLQKESKLVKCPRVGASTLCFVSGLSVGSVSNSSQVLNRNNRFLRLGLVDDGSTDIVVKPRLKPLFFPRQPFQQPTTSPSTASCAFRGLFLNRSSDLGKFVSNFLNGFAVPFIPIRSNGNTPAPKVNADNVIRLNWVWNFIRQLNVDVVQAIPMLGKSRRSRLSSFELTYLVVPKEHRDVFPSTNQCQANRPIFLPKGKNPSIVVSRCGLEYSDGFPLKLPGGFGEHRTCFTHLNLAGLE